VNAISSLAHVLSIPSLPLIDMSCNLLEALTAQPLTQHSRDHLSFLLTSEYPQALTHVLIRSAANYTAPGRIEDLYFSSSLLANLCCIRTLAIAVWKCVLPLSLPPHLLIRSEAEEAMSACAKRRSMGGVSAFAWIVHVVELGLQRPINKVNMKLIEHTLRTVMNMAGLYLFFSFFGPPFSSSSPLLCSACGEKQL
jgi:hypothetical protein